ncbi:MAG: tetratricopeptide repeat protein [Pseudomonadales bacterium]
MANVAMVSAVPRRALGAVATVCAIVFAMGCAMQTPFKLQGDLLFEPSLISGERLFGEPLAVEELPRYDILEPSANMRKYVAATVGDIRSSSRRFRELFRNLSQDGYFKAVYSADTTLTAADAFQSRGGNCLSYTNMFLALAREAGLTAEYQIVDVPPSWDADSGFLIRYTHINVLVRGVSLDYRPGDSIVIDFNDVHPDPDYPQQVVSDAYAESLFYANQSVNLLRVQQYRESFAFLRRALEIAPENVDLWINLGAFYATREDFQSSIDAYDVALQIDPRNKAAFAGLARSYANAGDFEQAAFYEDKVRRYRERNPYYHYALAQAAFADDDFERSLGYIQAAIGLRFRTPRFHLFKGLVEQRLGRPEAAEESFRRAQRYGIDRRVKLDMLRSMSGVAAS